MSHTVRKRFTPDEWRAVYLSIGHSNTLKHQNLRRPAARERMHQEYADGLEKLIRFQEQGWDIVCNRSARDLKANLLAWWYDQLTYSERWDQDLSQNSGYQLARQVLEDRATGRRPGAGTIYDQLFGDDDDHDQE